MLIRFSGGLSAAVLVTLALSPAGAQSPGSAATAPRQSGDAVTVAGCIVRDADYAAATGSAPAVGDKTAAAVHLVLTTGDVTEVAYSLTGTREPEVARYVGRRVEITGSLEQVRVAAPPPAAGGAANAGRVTGGRPPSGASGVTPAGSPAHEPGDGLSGTASTTGGAPERVAGARPGASSDTLPRVNVTSFRPLEGDCEELRASETAAPRPDSSRPQAERPAVRPALGSTARSEQRITAIGCLVRQTSAGAALSAQDVAADDLVLTGATVAPTPTPAGRSAIPGSAPSGSGSGTIPPAASAAQNLPNVEERSFALRVQGTEDRAALTKYIGQRIEITAMVDDTEAGSRRTDSAASLPATGESTAGTSGRAETPSSAAHPSAPVQRVTVASFRPVGGSCN
jgi:hypothetical protein